MTPKLFRAVEVCELAQLQPYVLRSWEKEFPGIGVQKSPEAQRLYRQSDVDQVLRIKQLVFNEGLTLAGARRRLEETALKSSAEERQEVEEVLEALASDARTRIANVRDGLRSILQMLSASPGSLVVVDVEPKEPAAASPRAAERAPATVRTLTPKTRAHERESEGKSGASRPAGPKVMAKAARTVKTGKTAAAGKAAAKGAAKKRSRASA